MQNSTDRALFELAAKRAARQALRESKRILVEQDGGIRATEAFANFFKALKLTAMGISNSLRLLYNVLFEFDAEKFDQAVFDFNDRRQRINTEWKPIKDAVQKTIGSLDPITKLSIIGPEAYWSIKGAGASLVAGKTVAEILAAEDWETLIGPYTRQLDTNQSIFAAHSAQMREMEKMKKQNMNLMQRLSDIFSESVKYSENKIHEQVAMTQPANSKVPEISEEEAVKMFIQATGMDMVFEKLRKQSMENLKQVMLQIIEQIEPAVASANLFAAKNLDEFKVAFLKARQQNPKLDPTVYDKLKKTVDEQSTFLIQNPEALSKMTKDVGRTLSPEEQQKSARQFVFDKAKEKFDNDTAEGLKKIVQYSDKAIKDLKIDDSILDSMRKSEHDDVKEVLEIYENLQRIYKGIKQDFETKAKSKVK